MIKKLYEIPESELIFVKVEENFLQSGPSLNSNNHTEYLGEEEDGGNLL